MKTRPTAGRVREALFSRLMSRYEMMGVDILDLYAGTGALGIEALSRGAARLLSVEQNRRACQIIRGNLSACGLESRAEVWQRDVARALAEIAGSKRRFGGVFLDPPYRKGMAAATLAGLEKHSIVAEGGWISVEAAPSDDLPMAQGRLVCLGEDLYGDTKLALYERQGV